MQDIHDERRVPLEVEPESRTLLESIRFWLSFGRHRRNRRDQRVQAARTARQIAEQAVAPMSRIGGGS